MAKPIVALEGGEQAIVVRRDVPEPVSYQGSNLIELDFNDDTVDEAGFYTEAAFVKREQPGTGGGSGGRPDIVRPIQPGTLDLALNIGTLNNFIASDSQVLKAERPGVAADNVATLRPDPAPGTAAGRTDLDAIADAFQPDRRPYFYRLVERLGRRPDCTAANTGPRAPDLHC